MLAYTHTYIYAYALLLTVLPNNFAIFILFFRVILFTKKLFRRKIKLFVQHFFGKGLLKEENIKNLQCKKCNNVNFFRTTYGVYVCLKILCLKNI